LSSRIIRSTRVSGPAGWRLQRHAQLDSVIRRVHQILLRAQIALCCLDGRMPQQHLDLLQLTTRRTAQLRTGAAAILRRDSGHAALGGIGPDKLPYQLLGQGSLVNFAATVYGSEDWALDPTGSA
jgi:hypothetical protein